MSFAELAELIQKDLVALLDEQCDDELIIACCHAVAERVHEFYSKVKKEIDNVPRQS
jgi:hypothetical protein